MATSDGVGKKRKTGNRSLTTPPTGGRDTSGGTSTSGAKSLNFSDMTPAEIVAIVANTAIVAGQTLDQLVVSNYTKEGKPGIVVMIPGWSVVNGEVVQA